MAPCCCTPCWSTAFPRRAPQTRTICKRLAFCRQCAQVDAAELLGRPAPRAAAARAVVHLSTVTAASFYVDAELIGQSKSTLSRPLTEHPLINQQQGMPEGRGGGWCIRSLYRHSPLSMQARRAGPAQQQLRRLVGRLLPSADVGAPRWWQRGVRAVGGWPKQGSCLVVLVQITSPRL